MVFKKYHCSKCGSKLKKEKTHRVVTKDDKDYHQYHRAGRFPRRDYDVYSYQFRCPLCESRISFEEHCIIEWIQKKYSRFVLSPSEIKENYKQGMEANDKRVLIRNICTSIFITMIALPLFYLFFTDITLPQLSIISIFFIVCTAVTVFRMVKDYKGNDKLKSNRSYTRKEKSQMERLHAYRSHNKDLIAKSEKCYCFYCKSVIKSSEIERYLDKEPTALCPKCGIDSIIPDAINEAVDESIISKMHEYWF